MKNQLFHTSGVAIMLLFVIALSLAAFRPTVALTTDGKPPRRVEKTEADWKEQLTPDQFTVTRKSGTERPCSSPLAQNHEVGTFRLGHVFTDGPAPAGFRYCLNGVALEFVKK